MKRINIILMAFAFVLTMTQCKKNEETTLNEVVTITLDLKYNNSSKVDVNTITGAVNFETGDKVYVGSDGKYVGTLTHNGTKFVGNITNPTEGQPLQFYFLGNETPAETLTAGTTESCSVVISDQTEHLPVISYAPSFENYVSGITAYTGHLLNKCALVKFNVTTPSDSPICITGMKNKVTVDFTQNTVTPSMDGEGVIMLPAGSGENVEKWAILLPQEALEEGEEGSAYSEDGTYTGIRPAIPLITENGYLADGFTLFFGVSSAPVGAINGLFSVSASRKIYFSKGNLQFIGSAAVPYWKFADNQWDYLGITTGQNSDSEIVNRDLFGWGTSGFDHGAVAYQPWATSTNYSHYYAYGNRQYNLYDQTGKADWGYNAIINGGNLLHIWRTLTKEEWEYLFNSRSSAKYKYGHGQVNEVNGMILLPDSWSLPEGLCFAPGNSDWANVYDIAQWDQMEAAGAVFLPAAGYRVGINVDNIEISGDYWSSTNFNDYPADHARYLVFSSNSLHATYTNHRNYGCSIRLVQDY